MISPMSFWSNIDKATMDPGVFAVDDLMELFNEDARVRRQDWWDCARICVDRVDGLILCGEMELAKKHSRYGEAYAREAIVRSAMPLEGIAPYTEEELLGEMYRALYVCDWVNTGKENEEYLDESYKRHKYGVVSELKRTPKQHRVDAIQNEVRRSCEAGDFVSALELASDVAKIRRFSLCTGILAGKFPDRLFLLLSTYMTDQNGKKELRDEVISAIQQHLGIWQSGNSRRIAGSVAEAITISYIGAKYFDELAVPELSREAIVRRVRYSGGLLYSIPKSKEGLE